MATWQQVKSYVYSKYQVSNDNGDMITLMFDTGSGRSQMVFVGVIEAGDFSQIRFSSPFAAWSKVSADRALRATEQAGGIGICSIGDYVVTTHSQLLSTIDEAEIDWPMLYVTQTADDLERLLGQGDAF
jgi:hypothetical protein